MHSEREKRIFPYWDGVRQLFGDPIAINRKLTEALGGNPNRVLAVAFLPKDQQMLNQLQPERIVEAMAARGQLVEAVRPAFEMAPWNQETGEGATEDDCFAALQQYVDFLSKKKPSGATSPSSSPPSETPYWADDPSTTMPSSASGAASG